jgi:hypothetical protein
MPPTASVLEIVWTLIAAIGFLGALGVAWDAYGDWRDARTKGRATLIARQGRLVAATVVRNRLATAFMQAVLIALGLRAMTLPPNPASTDFGTQLTGLAFIAGSFAMSVVSVLDFADRLRFHQLDSTPADGPLAGLRVWLTVRTKRLKREQTAADNAEAAAHPPEEIP